MPREEATVGALRRRAAGHDVSIMPRSTRVRTPDEKLEGFRSRARRAAGHDVSIMPRSTRVRTPDEKLEGFRVRARRAVAAAGN